MHGFYQGRGFEHRQRQQGDWDKSWEDAMAKGVVRMKSMEPPDWRYTNVHQNLPFKPATRSPCRGERYAYIHSTTALRSGELEASTEIENVVIENPRSIERYAVRRHLWNDILMRLQVKVPPSVDCFADGDFHLVPRWWGPGSSEYVDAFEAPWSEETLLFINAPFKVLEQVVDKIADELAKAILICPHWPSRPFLKKASTMTVRKYLYPKGTRLFEQKDASVSGIRWPCWALLLDGRLQNKSQEWDENYVTSTTSSRRRKRRKFKEEVIC